MLVVVLQVALQELLEAFLTAGANGTVVADQGDHGSTGLHALLLQPVSDTGAALPVVTGSVQNSELVGTFDDTVEGDEGDTFSDQGFLASHSGVFQSKEDNTGGVAIGDDLVGLVDLLLTGGSGHVDSLPSAGGIDLVDLLGGVGTGLSGPAMVGSGAEDVDGLAGGFSDFAALNGGLVVGLGSLVLGAASSQRQDQHQTQDDTNYLFHLCKHLHRFWGNNKGSCFTSFYISIVVKSINFAFPLAFSII